MCRKFTCCVALVTAISFVDGSLLADDDSEKGSVERSKLASQAISITNVVLENHIDPPTRQEMILSGTRALYRSRNQPIPKGLSSRISDLSGPDQLTTFLNGLREEFADLQGAETILSTGMLEAVAGHPLFMDPEISNIEAQLTANKYVGIGIALGMNREHKLPEIVQSIFEGPAWNAGIRSGDMIVSIETESTSSKSLGVIVRELRGVDGSKLTMEVRRGDSDEVRSFTMTRSRVFIPTVEGVRLKDEGGWQYVLESAKDIALLRVKRIGSSTLHELRRLEAKLRDQDVRGIILDLRTGGGYLHDTIVVADSLLDGGTIGFVRSLEKIKKHEARPGALFADLPMVVVVSKQLSAGNVFLTAALQDHGRAIVVGEPTVSESYVSSIMTVPGQARKIRLATGVMQRGDGTLLLPRKSSLPMVVRVENGKEVKPKRPGNIVPDHVVPAVRNQHGRDPMLTRAVELLKQAAAQSSPKAENEKVSG